MFLLSAFKHLNDNNESASYTLQVKEKDIDIHNINEYFFGIKNDKYRESNPGKIFESFTKLLGKNSGVDPFQSDYINVSEKLKEYYTEENYTRVNDYGNKEIPSYISPFKKANEYSFENLDNQKNITKYYIKGDTFNYNANKEWQGSSDKPDLIKAMQDIFPNKCTPYNYKKNNNLIQLKKDRQQIGKDLEDRTKFYKGDPHEFIKLILKQPENKGMSFVQGSFDSGGSLGIFFQTFWATATSFFVMDDYGIDVLESEVYPNNFRGKKSTRRMCLNAQAKIENSIYFEPLIFLLDGLGYCEKYVYCAGRCEHDFNSENVYIEGENTIFFSKFFVDFFICSLLYQGYKDIYEAPFINDLKKIGYTPPISPNIKDVLNSKQLINTQNNKYSAYSLYKAIDAMKNRESISYDQYSYILKDIKMKLGDPNFPPETLVLDVVRYNI